MHIRSFEQIEFPYPELDRTEYTITGLDEGAKLIIPQRLQKAVFAVAVTPVGHPFPAEPLSSAQYALPSVPPSGTRVVGTGFRFHDTGLFITVAHHFEEGEWRDLLKQRRLLGICAIPGASWTPLPILAICSDQKRDLAVGLLPHPALRDEAFLVGDLPISTLPPPASIVGMLFAAGFQDTQYNDERIDLNPILFRGEEYSLKPGPHCIDVGRRAVTIQETVIQVPMKARPGLSGAPLIIFEGPDSRDEFIAGRVYGVQSFTREVSPELTLAHFIPAHHALDIRLDHPAFGGIRGKTLNQAFVRT